MLHQFYAVTETSVYFVKWRRSKSNPVPVARKIAIKGDSCFHVGDELNGVGMIAITKQLQAYVPEGCGWTVPNTKVERKIERVNTHYWGGHSSPIIALFTTKKKAMECFAHHPDYSPCDQRWIDDTRRVIEKIGKDHPSFEVCQWEPLKLLAA